MYFLETKDKVFINRRSYWTVGPAYGGPTVCSFLAQWCGLGGPAAQIAKSFMTPACNYMDIPFSSPHNEPQSIMQYVCTDIHLCTTHSR